ncbi:MAG: RHS repeat-associated core domain-containing protein, partial [Desulfobacteraceae bacterium]|nr:RHS repeat-associated core domain-containing protein [Desulfobacteraceae bacterium]
NVNYFHKDHLGSSSVITDASGKLKEKSRYMPFGGKRGEGAGISSSSYQFTDQELDKESGLYNYDARLYDPIIGRFASADTIVPGLYNSQAFDRYAYTLNNPLKYTDPSGHLGQSTDESSEQSNQDGNGDGQDNENSSEVGSEFEELYSEVMEYKDPLVKDGKYGFWDQVKTTYHSLDVGYRNRVENIKNAGIKGIFGAIFGFKSAKSVKSLSKAAKNTAKAAPKSAKQFKSKRAAFRESKRDAGIPTSQTHTTHTKNLKADALDKRRTATEYDFGHGRKVQSHPDGHTFSDGGVYDKSHFNNHGKDGTGIHYEY